MYAILPNILPANRASVNDYLETIYVDITTLTNAVNHCPFNDALQAKFQSYNESEEARLKTNLEAVDYRIDGEDTLALVTGSGRIERVGSRSP